MPAKRLQRRHANARWGGWMTIEALGAVVVFGLGVLAYGQAQARYAAELQAQNAAQHLRAFHQAADSYVRSNYAALVTATAGGPISINVATLVAAGNLDPGVLASGYPNAFRQTPVAWVRTVVCVPTACPNRLELVSIPTGGTALPRQTAVDIALKAFGLGTVAAFQEPAAPATLRRPYGAGTVDLTPYAALGIPAAGRAAAISFFDGTQLGSDYLARVNTGNPADNRMMTAIDMNGNQIANAGDITANDVRLSGKGNQWASAAISNAIVVASGASIAKPTCPHGTPTIYLSFNNIGADAAGTLFSSVQSWAVDAGANWTVNMRVRTAAGWQIPPDGIGNLLALTKCD